MVKLTLSIQNDESKYIFTLNRANCLGGELGDLPSQISFCLLRIVRRIQLVLEYASLDDVPRFNSATYRNGHLPDLLRLRAARPGLLLVLSA